jgi:WD40 repeat protein
MRRARRWALAVTAVPLLVAGAFAAATPAPVVDTSLSSHFTPAGHIPTPGRPMSIAWNPTGDKVALGGHFGEKKTGQRYDTRTADVRGQKLLKSFDCHYWWAIAQTWSRNPYIGEVIVDGGGDHMVKIWDANGPGSPKCNPGQFKAEHGAKQGLYNINGWITSLAFSPDGKYLAGASRDRTIRIWQIVPGPNQFKVVKLWYDKPAGQFLSVRWAADGKRIVTGDRSGRVAEWAFDPATDVWDQAQIDEYAKVAWAGQTSYFNKNAAKLAGKLLWSEGLHKQVWNARYSPDGKRVAAVGTDGTLNVYEARTGRVQYRVNAPRNSPQHALDWSPDGLLIATGGGDKNVYVYSAANGALYDTLVGHKTLVSAVAWSPNGRTLATAAGGQRISEALNQVRQGPDDAIHLWTRK